MNESPCELVVTTGGAHAIRDCLTGEIMHPVVGPIVEAQTLYLAPSRLHERLASPSTEPLVLLDIGLGAGSLAAAAWQCATALTGSGRLLQIVSFDRSLHALDLACSHGEAFAYDREFLAAAATLMREGAVSTPFCHWRLILGDMPATLHMQAAESADIVYWDPFSPQANPELWTLAAFTALRRLCRAGATVHTYSGATATRSALLLAGFAVGRSIKTPAGRETTAAALKCSDLADPLDQRWLDRLTRSSAPFPCDAPADALARIGQCIPHNNF